MSLKDDLINDLDEIFELNEFAVSVVLSTGNKIAGIFDDEYRGVNLQGGDIRTTSPQVLCKVADVEDVSLGALITINSKNYTVIERQPDGTGLITLILTESSNTSQEEGEEDEQEEQENDE